MKNTFKCMATPSDNLRVIGNNGELLLIITQDGKECRVSISKKQQTRLIRNIESNLNNG